MTKVGAKKMTIALIAVLAAWNLLWFLITTVQYHTFIAVVPKDRSGLHYLKNEDGFSYYVKKPDYLSFSGNLGVLNEPMQEALIIWPRLFGGYQYGFRLQKDGKAYEIYVNEQMEPLDGSDPTAVQKIEEYQTELTGLFSRANALWNLK